MLPKEPMLVTDETAFEMGARGKRAQAEGFGVTSKLIARIIRILWSAGEQRAIQ